MNIITLMKIININGKRVKNKSFKFGGKKEN